MSKLLITFLTLIFAPVAMALTIATGSPGGTYYRIGEDIKKLTAKAGLQIQVLATNGSFDNIMPSLMVLDTTLSRENNFVSLSK